MDDDLTVSKFEEYVSFVDAVSSESTQSTKSLIDTIGIMEEQGAKESRLLTAGIGLSGEVGELNDIIKKVVFQGAEYDDYTKLHLKKELGDIC